MFFADETSLMKFAGELAKVTPMGTVIFLYGPLGAGKTTFSRGFLQGMGYAGKVKSPTYTLVEPYEVKQGYVFHFDFYRIKAPSELIDIGFQDYLTKEAICLIEWPELAKELMPISDLSCYIDMVSSGREIKLIADSPRGKDILRKLTDII